MYDDRKYEGLRSLSCMAYILPVRAPVEMISMTACKRSRIASVKTVCIGSMFQQIVCLNINRRTRRATTAASRVPDNQVALVGGELFTLVYIGK